jgi:hypothetical protein
MSRANAYMRLSVQQVASGRCFRAYSNQPWDPTNPTSFWTSGASAYKDRKPTRSREWLLHPWLPVDIRLPVVTGILGAAAYIYLERTRTLEAAQKRSKDAWDTYIAPWLPFRQAQSSEERHHCEANGMSATGETKQEGIGLNSVTIGGFAPLQNTGNGIFRSAALSR